MTPKETVLLTRYVKACCPQQVMDEFTADAWHDLLADLGLEECRAAVVTVARRQPFVAASEIRAEAKRARRETEGRHRIRDLLNPAAYRRQVEAADSRTLALIQAKAGRTLAIDGPPPLPREPAPAPAGRPLTDPQAEALRQVARSRELRGAEVPSA